MALVARILESGEYTEVVRAGMKREMLGDHAGIYWDVLSEFFQEHDKVPSVDMFTALCPDYDHQPTSDPIDALIQELKTIHLGTEINRALNLLVDENSSDPWEAKRTLIRIADQINAQHQLRNTRVAAGEKVDYVLSMIKRLRDGCGLLGLKWPFEKLNKRTPGIMPGNVIYFYGRHKSKKTWLMLHMALDFWLEGHRVLFFTREMSIEELHWRLAGMILGIPLDDLNSGCVTHHGEMAVADVMKELVDSGRFIFSENLQGLPGYKAEIHDVQPDIILHDYWKAMADDLMEERRVSEKSAVDRTIDQLVKHHMKIKTPVIICGHANRDGDKSKGRSGVEHAWSDHIVRRVHAAIRVIKSPDESKLGLVVNAGRAIPEDLVITLDGHLCMGFGEELDIDPGWISTTESSQDASSQSAGRNKDREPPAMSAVKALKSGVFKGFMKRK